MQLIIKQKDKEITSMIDRLMKFSGTNLTKVCKEHKLNYANTYSKINRDEIDVKFLRELTKKINKKSKIKDEFSLSLMVDDKIIFNHKNPKK